MIAQLFTSPFNSIGSTQNHKNSHWAKRQQCEETKSVVDVARSAPGGNPQANYGHICNTFAAMLGKFHAWHGHHGISR
jgi:hypothetical protein